MYKILFAKDTKGNLLIWKAKIVNGEEVSIVISYGRLFGNLHRDVEEIKEGKNLNKSNETTLYEQAQSRLKSRMNKKIRQGYIALTSEQEYNYLKIDTQEETEKYLNDIVPDERKDAEGFIKPMKASQYYRSKKDWTDSTGKVWKDRKYYYLRNPSEVKEDKAIAIKFPCILQPKINGVRATISLDSNGEVQIKSKEGLRYDSLHHIIDFFNINIDILKEDIILDGELYIKGEALQDIGSAVKAFNINTPRVKFILFDLAIPELTNVERLQYIKVNILPKLNLTSPIEVIDSFKVSSDAVVQTLTDRYIEQGYEGSILRTFEATYQFGSRKTNMVKLKRLISHDFVIKSVEPQPKRPDLALFVCTYKGKTFKVNPTQSDAVKAKILLSKNYYKGAKLQCDFYEWTNDGKPFHIINTTIRDYE